MDEYVSKMKFGVQIYVGVCVLWSLVWYSGAFEYVFGANAWERFIGRSRRMGRTDFSRAGVVNDEKDSEEGSLFSRGRGREEKSRPSRLKRRGDFGGIPESKRGEENVVADARNHPAVTIKQPFDVKTYKRKSDGFFPIDDNCETEKRLGICKVQVSSNDDDDKRERTRCNITFCLFV